MSQWLTVCQSLTRVCASSVLSCDQVALTGSIPIVIRNPYYQLAVFTSFKPTLNYPELQGRLQWGKSKEKTTICSAMQWKTNLGLKHSYGFHHFKNLHQAPQRHNACARQQFKNEALPQQGMHSHFFPIANVAHEWKTAALEQILAGRTRNRTTSGIHSHISEHIHRSWTKPRHKHTIWISAQAADTYLAEV